MKELNELNELYKIREKIHDLWSCISSLPDYVGRNRYDH